MLFQGLLLPLSKIQLVMRQFSVFDSIQQFCLQRSDHRLKTIWVATEVLGTSPRAAFTTLQKLHQLAFPFLEGGHSWRSRLLSGYLVQNIAHALSWSCKRFLELEPPYFLAVIREGLGCLIESGSIAHTQSRSAQHSTTTASPVENPRPSKMWPDSVH